MPGLCGEQPQLFSDLWLICIDRTRDMTGYSFVLMIRMASLIVSADSLSIVTLSILKIWSPQMLMIWKVLMKLLCNGVNILSTASK